MREFLAIVCALGAAFAQPAVAGDAQRTSFVFSQELHATSDALDSIVVVPDLYRLTSASIRFADDFAEGALTLKGSFEETRYRRLAIENDRGVTLSAAYERHLGDRVEFRGTLGYAFADEGDDVPFLRGDGALDAFGIRTRTHTVSASGELGIDLGRGFALLLAASDRLARSGASIFEAGILPPLKIEPDRHAPALSVALKHREAGRTLGVSAALRLSDAEEIGSPPSVFSARLLSLAAELGIENPGGPAFGLSFGLQSLRGAHGLVEETRPAGRAAFTFPFRALKFSGALDARYELDDTDDPLASYRLRGELELAWLMRENMVFGAGVFAERLRNVALGWRERTRGVYAELEYRAAEHLTLRIRADVDETRSPLYRPEKRRIAGFVAVRAAI